MKNKLDLSLENIKNLHNKCKNQKEDLYTFLKKEFPSLSVEERLKYLATILNDFIEEYEWDEKNRSSKTNIRINNSCREGDKLI